MGAIYIKDICVVAELCKICTCLVYVLLSTIYQTGAWPWCVYVQKQVTSVFDLPSVTTFSTAGIVSKAVKLILYGGGISRRITLNNAH